MDLVERQPSVPVIRHPWEQARRRFIVRTLRDEMHSQSIVPTTAIDIGSGDAWLTDALARDFGFSLVHGIDTGYTDVDCRTLGTDRITLARTLPSERADVVLLLDVIEHVKDDTELLRAARDRLNDTGIVMVTVPAWPRLATQHDRVLGHYRRYTPQRLSEALSQAGLAESRMGGAFWSLLPVRAAQRVLERACGPRSPRNLGNWNGSARLTTALSAALERDTELGRRAASHGLIVPGLTLWATAVRTT